MKRFMQTVKMRFSQSVVARFGGAKLVQDSGIKLQVRGGTKAEQAEAQEWIALFRHDAVLQTKS